MTTLAKVLPFVPRQRDAHPSPLERLAEALEAGGRTLLVPLDRLELVGHLDAADGVPALHLYCHGGLHSLAVDDEGRTWVPRVDGRRRTGVRWVQVQGWTALHRAGIPWQPPTKPLHAGANHY